MLLISCLLLLLLGGVYWQLRSPEVAKPVAVSEVKAVTKPPIVQPDVAPTLIVKEGSAQSLPIAVVVNKLAFTKRTAKVIKARYDVDPVDAPVAVEASLPVVREVVTPSATPVAPSVTADVRAKVADPAPIVPTELKPIVQPLPVAAAVTAPLSTSVPMPITASAASMPKRKTKNNEDVEIDPQ